MTFSYSNRKWWKPVSITSGVCLTIVSNSVQQGWAWNPDRSLRRWSPATCHIGPLHRMLSRGVVRRLLLSPSGLSSCGCHGRPWGTAPGEWRIQSSEVYPWPEPLGLAQAALGSSSVCVHQNWALIEILCENKPVLPWDAQHSHPWRGLCSAESEEARRTSHKQVKRLPQGSFWPSITSSRSAGLWWLTRGGSILKQSKSSSALSCWNIQTPAQKPPQGRLCIPVGQERDWVQYWSLPAPAPVPSSVAWV